MIVTGGLGRDIDVLGIIVAGGLGRNVLSGIVESTQDNGGGPDAEEDFLKARDQVARDRYRKDAAPSQRPAGWHQDGHPSSPGLVGETGPAVPARPGDGLQAIGAFPIDIDIRIAVQKVVRAAELKKEEEDGVAAVIAMMLADE